MILLAHRANLAGPQPAAENSFAACARALAEGFGLELDLRRDATGAFYISHDPQPLTPQNNLEKFSALFRQHPNAELAINVKELGYESTLIELMNSGQLGARSFYFDFELLEHKTPGAAQQKIKSLSGRNRIRLASRLSDRHESVSQTLTIPAEIVWGDEFDTLWLTESDVQQIHAADRVLYMISPELHGFDLAAVKRRWHDFKTWNVDGLCTDFPLEAREFFK